MSPEYLRGYGKLGQEGVDRENKSKARDILPVPRTKEEAKQVYDRLSKFYDYTLGLLGRKYSEMALERLSVVEREMVMEIGFGTGHCLKWIAKLVGPAGKGYGIDISPEMIEKTKKRLEKEGLANRAELCCGDATCLPFNESAFDAVFLSFTLEVFDTPDIPRVLIYAEQCLIDAGYQIKSKEKIKIFRLPAEIIVAIKAMP